MLMICMRSFSAKKTSVATSDAESSRLIVICQPSKSFAQLPLCAARVSGLQFIKGVNVVSETTTQNTSDSEISTFLRRRAYFRVPELIMPQRNWKMNGKDFAKSLVTHKL